MMRFKLERKTISLIDHMFRANCCKRFTNGEVKENRVGKKKDRNVSKHAGRGKSSTNGAGYSGPCEMEGIQTSDDRLAGREISSSKDM